MGLHNLFEELDCLNSIKPEEFTSHEGGKDIEDSNIECDFHQIDKKILTCEVPYTSNWWQFIKLLSNKLLSTLKELEKDNLISIKNKLILRKSCCKLVSFGILPCLPFTILNFHHSHVPLHLTNDEKNYCIKYVVDIVLKLIHNDVFKEILTAHVCEIMAGLIHILFYIKSAYEDREQYKLQFINLVDNYNQSIVIKNLMLLNCCKGDSAKVGRVVRQILVKKMMKEGGLGSLVSSVLTEGSSTCDIIKLAQLVSHKHPQDGYYEHVLPQVLPLLRSKEERVREVGSQCLVLVQDKDLSACEEFLLKPMMSPLESPSGEDIIEDTLITLRNLFDGNICRTAPLFIVKRICPTLVVAYSNTSDSPCRLKKILATLLLKCFESLSKDNFSEMLSKILCPSLSVNFKIGPTGGLITTSDKFSVDFNLWPKTLHDLICSSANLKITFYTTLLLSLNNLQVDEKVIATQLLSSLSTDADVLKALSAEPRSLIEFLVNLLETDFDSNVDSVSIALVILSIIINDKLMHKKRNWALFDRLIEPLKKVKHNSVNGELRVLSDEVLCLLVAKGILGTSIATRNELNDIRSREEKTDYQKAIEDSKDPHLPVRAHALRQLGQLISQKDKTAISNRDLIIALLKEGLKDDDSYMYLSSIEALSCVASEFPDEVLNSLCDQFVHAATPELRLKVGEVLTKTSRRLGEVCSIYKTKLINTFLGGCRDSDHLVRASSLSNLGEICQILSFNITSYVVEILDAIESIVDTDKELEPRRAAVMVITQMFKGLNSNIFPVLEHVLPPLYQKLKYIYLNDKDDVTKLHAQLALEELKSNSLTLLFPEQSFEKKVSIHDY